MQGRDGDVDKTRGFGVGKASRDAKAEPNAVANAKKRDAAAAAAVKKKKGGKDDDSPPGTRQSNRKGAAAKDDRQTDRTHPDSSIPSRQEAFEEFKSTRGSEINRILIENKDVLSSKKRTYTELARQINSTKSEIDSSRDRLERLKEERESEGYTYNDEGEQIISEEEFVEIKTLKDLKSTYKNDYEELKSVRSEVLYCQKQVDRCRQRLVLEFDKWYSESYGVDQSSSNEAGIGRIPGTTLPQELVLDDEGERFDQLHRDILMEKPDEFAYYHSNIQHNKRMLNQKVLTQGQPYYQPPKPVTPLNLPPVGKQY